MEVQSRDILFGTRREIIMMDMNLLAVVTQPDIIPAKDDDVTLLRKLHLKIILRKAQTNCYINDPNHRKQKE